MWTLVHHYFSVVIEKLEMKNVKILHFGRTSFFLQCESIGLVLSNKI